MNLFQFVGQSLFATELVLVQSEDELLVVLDGVLVQLVQGRIEVELVGVQSGLFGKHGVHILIRDDGHSFDIGVVTVNPVLVDGDVFGVQQLGAGRVLAEDVFAGRAGVHECLRGHRQTTVHDVGLADVKDKVGVFDQINPESQW